MKFIFFHVNTQKISLINAQPLSSFILIHVVSDSFPLMLLLT